MRCLLDGDARPRRAYNDDIGAGRTRRPCLWRGLRALWRQVDRAFSGGRTKLKPPSSAGHGAGMGGVTSFWVIRPREPLFPGSAVADAVGTTAGTRAMLPPGLDRSPALFRQAGGRGISLGQVLVCGMKYSRGAASKKLKSTRPSGPELIVCELPGQ